jgi:uncharacterized membrane protein YkvA (DUF1232 family)
VLGYLDDAILLPVLILVAVRMVPGDVLEECRSRADRWMDATGAKPRSVAGGVVIALIWIAAVAAACWFVTSFV